MPVSLPEIPPRIARLPKDERGYPVPWFVAYFKDGKEVARPEGEPDLRILASGRRERAVKKRLCWVCGEPLGVHQVFAIGPMCAVNRTTMEPPSHRDCAEFSVRACPFLTVPRRRRDERGLEAIEHQVSGTMIARNPGATALWESAYRPFKVDNGWLIQLGAPTRVDWWTQGRQATRAEIAASIDSGYPILLEEALKDGQEAVEALARQTFEALKLLPAA